ncbi:lysophospholipase-like protein 1 [Drosophila innubila]|uniref:lysophospholipase-like protein 1 n=1 Tax=Drosophila innubila TaxID=198719 RepID=UPI00148D3BF2|nr:lysophospholipase-like protein 1 [Drosophila innubila]
MLRKPSASVIFFHGSGDTGAGIMDWVRSLIGRDLDGSHIRYVYPTAPLQKYTPFGGEESTVWFDRKDVDIAAIEDRESMSRSYDIARRLIQKQVNDGIPLHRIIVGGYSMGGALALHTGYHVNTNLAGVFAHSSFLNRNSVVYKSLQEISNGNHPELCMFQGSDDEVVEFDWGFETFNTLIKLGVSGSFTVLHDTTHELQKSSLLDIEQWILQKLP